MVARAADLLRDDFNGASLDFGNWSTGTWQLGRTQLGFTPAVTGGMAQLRHDTYNPANPGGTFKGTEILSNQNFSRGSGLEYEARVRTNAVPSGLVTSFFTYNTVGGSPPLADEIDWEFLTKEINASSPTSDPVLATTWNNYRTDGSNFGDPNIHSSQDISVAGLNLATFNTFKIRWLPDRVQWYVNDVPIRTSLYAVPDLAAPIRANFWAPGTEWPDAYSAAYAPTAIAGNNQTSLYDIDYIAVRRIFDPVAASSATRVLTDNFNNGNVANSNTINGFWSQKNLGTSSVTETSATPANLADPLKLTASGAGYPHAQIASGVRSEFNLFRTPVAIEATGIGFSSTSNSTTVNTIGKSILRFVLGSQTLPTGNDSEYTMPDALALRIEGGNLVALGYKVNTTNANTEFANNLLSQTMSGPVRRIYLVAHGSFYYLQVTHDVSNTDSTQTTNEFTGALTLNLSDWNATGDSSMYIQGQLNNSGANENMTALVGSVAVSAVKPTWNVDAGGNWSNVSNWTDKPAPNYRGAFARFNNAIQSARTVSADVPIQAGTLSFNSALPYTIAGASTITLNTYLDDARIETIAGSHTIAAPITLATNTTIDAAAGTSITLSGDMTGQSFTVSKTGTGEAIVKHLRAGAVNVNAGQVHVLADGGAGGTSKIAALTIALNAKLDLTNNKLITTSPVGTLVGSTYTGVTGQIQSGRNGGGWNGATGIVTSMSDAANGNLTTLAIARASDVRPSTASATATWGGQTITGSDTLVMYTYGGDATLDGKLNIDDYVRIDSGLAGGFTGWSNGDFNYDGKVNIDDYTTVLDANLGNQNGTFFAAGGLAGVTAIPEPHVAGLITLCASLLAQRRSRRAVEHKAHG
jgi:beta-glucanase (GH16 family)